jgi:hypothetical protein
MKINILKAGREFFFQTASLASCAWQKFPVRPPCQVGELLEFCFDGAKVATATCTQIDEPEAKPFRRVWIVRWDPTTFRALLPRDFKVPLEEIEVEVLS